MTNSFTSGKRTQGPASSRRVVLLGSGAAAIGFGMSSAIAQKKEEAPADMAAELLKSGPLPDIVLGKADAPVVIVEYASLTCGHCANFHNTVFEKLKEKYIDTGKARFILREFPLDNRAAAAAMVARCVGMEKAPALISEMFKKQESWAFVQANAFLPALFEVSKSSGIAKEAFDKCVTDQKLLEQVAAARDVANKKFGVRSTPTFFVNGRRLDGNPGAIESFDKAIEAAAAPAKPAEKK